MPARMWLFVVLGWIAVYAIGVGLIRGWRRGQYYRSSQYYRSRWWISYGIWTVAMAAIVAIQVAAFSSFGTR